MPSSGNRFTARALAAFTLTALPALGGLATLTATPAIAQVGGIAIQAFGARAWREPVATVDALPVTGNRVNDVRMVAADLSLWSWDGDVWAQIATGVTGDDGGGASTPSGPAGGDLTGTYPDPTIAADAVTLGVNTVGGYAGSSTEGGPATSALTATTADVATALAADGLNCSAGSYPLGVDATGAAQSCTVLPSPGVTSHGALTGLTADDHPQYALLAGRDGGQTLTGGTSSGSLTLKATTASAAFTLAGSVLTVPTSNTVNQITGTSEFGIRFGGGNVGNAVGFWYGDSAYLVCDGNTNSCTVKGNSALGWGNASGGSSDQFALRSPAQGVMSLTDPATGGAGAIRVLRSERTVVAIVDNGVGASPAAATLTPTTSYAEVTCADADGCTVTLSETGIQPGQTLIVAVVAASLGAVTIADTAGVSELAGAWVGAADDTLTLIYGGDRWRETGRSDN